MKGYVERVIKNYPKMVRERSRLREQLRTCEFLTAEELISTMCFSYQQGERVQSSELSDKTAKIAIVYRDKLDRINLELIEPMQERYERLDAEIKFMEQLIRELPEELSKLMEALAIKKMTWDELELSFCLNRRTISEYRKRAIDYLVREYQIRESQMEAYLLS